MSLIMFPYGFVPTRYVGYYWNVNEERLYTCKGGVLKPMKLKKPFRHRPASYGIYDNGMKKHISLESLKRLKSNNETLFFPISR